MSALPPVQSLVKEHLLTADGQLDPERLLFGLNQFMGSVYAALNRGIALGENIMAEVKEISPFTTGATVESTFPLFVTMSKGMPAIPRAAWLVNPRNLTSPGTIFYSPPSATCEWVGDGRIRIPFISGLEASTRYAAALFIWGK